MGAETDIKVNITGEQTVTPAAAGAAAGLDGLKTEVKGATEAAGEHNIKTREMRLLFTEINKILPGLGHDLHAAFAGPLGIVILAATAISEATEKLKEWNKSLDDSAAAAADPTFLTAMEDHAKVFSEMIAAADAYVLKLNDIKTSEASIADQLRDQLALDKAIEVARAELTSAQKGLALAQLQQDEAAHKITPVEAAKKRADLEKSFNDKAQKEKEAAEDQEIAATQAKAIQAAGKQAQLEKDAAAARLAAAKDEAHNKAATTDFGDTQTFQKNLASAQAEKDAADKDLWWANLESLGFRGRQHSGADEYLTDSEQRVARADSQLNNLQRGRTQFLATQTPEAIAESGQRKHDQELAEKKAEENAAETKKLTEQLRQLNATLAATRPLERQTTDTKNQTIDVQSKTSREQDLQRDIDTIKHFAGANAGAKVSPEQIAAVAAAIKDYNEIIKELPDLLQETSRLGVTKPQLAAAIAALKKDQAAAADQAATSNTTSLGF